MKCPYCNHDFPLTWSRYLLTPSGRHTCPSCRRESKLDLSRSYFIKSLLPILLVAAVSAKLATLFFSHTLWSALGAVFVCILLGIPWDRHCDQSRALKPIPKPSQK